MIEDATRPDDTLVEPSGWFAVQLRYAYLAGDAERVTLVEDRVVLVDGADEEAALGRAVEMAPEYEDDFETDEESSVSSAAPPPEDDFEALGPAEEEAPYLEEEEPYAEEPVSGSDTPVEEPGTEVRPALEDKEAYEGGADDPEESWEEEEESEEGLWFEKGPPKDFDFDD